MTLEKSHALNVTSWCSFSSKRRGKCHHQYLCNYSSFIIKYRAPPLPVPAWGLSACETPSTSYDGQSHTLPGNVPRRSHWTDVVTLRLDWFCSQKIYTHPQSKDAGRRKWTTERNYFSIQAQRSNIIPSERGGQYTLQRHMSPERQGGRYEL